MRIIQRLCLIALLTSCGSTSQPRVECAVPLNQQAVPQQLAKCLSARSNADEARQVLEQWKLIQPKSSTSWGDTQTADLLSNNGDEIIAVYCPKLDEVIWNPQGKLIALAHTNHTDSWKPVFDADTLELDKGADGNVWHNWSYWPMLTQDFTGDNRPDLLVRAEYYNGRHTVMSRIIVLSAQGSGAQPLHLVLNLDNLDEGATFQVIGAGITAQLQSVHAIGSSGYLTRTFAFDGNTLVKVSELMDPPYAMVQLIQTLHDKPVPPDSLEVQQAYALIASAWSHSVGQPVAHPDEQVLAEILLLQLEQIALLNRENADPSKNPDPQSTPYQQYMRAATRRMWNDALKSAQRAPHAGELFAVVPAAWQPQERDHLKHVCDAIQYFVSLHPDWLDAMSRAAHGVTQLHASTVCVA